MAEFNNAVLNGGCHGGNTFNEAVCISADRIYDSCSDKDCMTDLQVYFTLSDQALVDAASMVKCRDVELINAFVDVQPVPFDRGFYSVDINYYFRVRLELCSAPMAAPVTVCGLALSSKKSILYGSEGGVKVFRSDCEGAQVTCMPTATVQTAQPIALSAKICEAPSCCCCECPCAPASVCSCFSGNFGVVAPLKLVYVTIGLFSIITLQRPVQMLIPAYDFCVPQKASCDESDEPCDVFSRLNFPVDEFFPPRMAEETGRGGGCGCRG